MKNNYKARARLVTLPEYAKMHNVTPRAVRGKIARGSINARKIGRDWVLAADEPYTDRRYKAEKLKEVKKMENNRVKINVTISHFVLGQGIQYTSDIDPFYIDAEDLRDPAEISKAIAEYCEEWASWETRYDANEEDFIVEFWYDGERIGKALLSDYADYMTD